MNAKQVLMSAYNNAKEDDQVIVISIRDEDKENFYQQVLTTDMNYITRMGILEVAKQHEVEE
ncbi:hypothetical protein [Mammaliicoccus fleurettii]|uniref:hypothetical protein n=1 Tax=Mammaliicoccus fleurettii TaxID=150056 RepID=UPI001AAD469F|nr:hypothetical protein [Mammaliicoccus fleurettii]MBO3062737.1 hypothetical protein [Mammaliicoccus fleurettii]